MLVTERHCLIERPADVNNRLSLAVVMVLAVMACFGCLLGCFAPFGHKDVVVGTEIASAAGLCGFALSALVLTRRVPAPAWNWVRMPIAGGGGKGVFSLAFGGIVVVVWSLFVAGFAGFMWARVGLGMVVLFGVLLGPLLQRGGFGRYPRHTPPQPPSLRRPNASGSRDGGAGLD